MAPGVISTDEQQDLEISPEKEDEEPIEIRESREVIAAIMDPTGGYRYTNRLVEDFTTNYVDYRSRTIPVLDKLKEEIEIKYLDPERHIQRTEVMHDVRRYLVIYTLNKFPLNNFHRVLRNLDETFEQTAMKGNKARIIGFLKAAQTSDKSSSAISSFAIEVMISKL
jgi:hypothetical protein